MAPRLLLSELGETLSEEERRIPCFGLPNVLEPADTDVSPWPWAEEASGASPRAWMSTELCSRAARGLLCDDLETK